MNRSRLGWTLFLLWGGGVTLLAQAPRVIELDEATVAQINTAFDAGSLTAEQLVKMCLSRIEAYDKQGPSVRALLTVNPRAVETARQLDVERRTKAGDRTCNSCSQASETYTTITRPGDPHSLTPPIHKSRKWGNDENGIAAVRR